MMLENVFINKFFLGEGEISEIEINLVVIND